MMILTWWPIGISTRPLDSTDHWNQYRLLEPVPDHWNQCRTTFWCLFAFTKLTQQLYLAAWAGRIAWHPRLDALPWALGWGTGSADCCVWPWSWQTSPGNRDQGETQPKEGWRGRWGRGCEMGEDVRWGRMWDRGGGGREGMRMWGGEGYEMMRVCKVGGGRMCSEVVRQERNSARCDVNIPSVY